jgi:hypothetical protein
MIVICREYKESKSQRMEGRAEYHRQHPRRRGRRAPSFPLHLAELLSFALWLQNEIERRLRAGKIVDHMVVDLSRASRWESTAYRAMKAYGMHLRCISAKIGKETADSGIAATFRHPSRQTNDNCDLEELQNVEYVGWIEEIVELDYRRYYVVLLMCDWVKARLSRPNPTIKRDDYGFTTANNSESSLMGHCPESYAFPIHVQQVYFSEDRMNLGWKVVSKVEVRGRRGDRHYALQYACGLLSVGRDFEFAGFNIPDSNVNLPDVRAIPVDG